MSARAYMRGIARSLREFCGKALGIDEIRSSQTLILVAWVLLFGWFLEFSTWIHFGDFTVNAVSEGRHLCWPFFQECGEWYFLTQPPLGNTHALAYAVLFALLVAAGLALARRKFLAVHGIFLLFFLWEMFVMGMSMRLAVNYWYFHALYAALFLFSRERLFVLRLGAVMLYFLSGILKLNAGWIQGTYFTSLRDGLYFIPDALIPLATNGVIILELVIVWFLFSSRRSVRYAVLALLSVFHTYSVVYVGYTYPAVAFPMVLVLFLPMDRVLVSRELLRRAAVGVGILCAVLLAHIAYYATYGFQPFSLEGNKLRMYMFDANYQCRSSATFMYADGSSRALTSDSYYAKYRCDPYAHWFYFNQLCGERGGPESVRWTFDSSVNGSPFFRIIDVADACALPYRPFGRNAWIRVPGEELVPIVGYPEKNEYRPESSP